MPRRSSYLTRETVRSTTIRVGVSSFCSTAGFALSSVVIAWIIFVASSSVLVVGLAIALRFLPLLLLGAPSGAAVDRLGGRAVLVPANLVAAGIMTVLYVEPGGSAGALPVAIGSALIIGAADAARLVAIANLAFASGQDRPTQAIGAVTLMSAAGQSSGALIGAVTVASFGVQAACFASAVGYGLGALTASFMRVGGRPRIASDEFALPIGAALKLLVRLPVVRLLLIVAAIVEMFGFSSAALEAPFAGDVFSGTAVALSVILASRSLGRFLGAAILISGPIHRMTLKTLLLSVCLFGSALLIYALAPSLLVAAPALFVAGLCGALVDGLEQSHLQAAVPEGVRGRVVGLWIMSLGVGFAGLVTIALLAGAVGPRPAQALFGALLLSSGAFLLTPRVSRWYERPTTE